MEMDESGEIESKRGIEKSIEIAQRWGGKSTSEVNCGLNEVYEDFQEVVVHGGSELIFGEAVVYDDELQKYP